MVYDPDLDQIVDLQPCEDAYASERVSVLPLLARATKGQLWMADRLYCTLPVMQAREETQASLTPLHRDDSDNLFAQVWGEKSMLLAAPHHRIALGSLSTSPNGGLEGCDFDPSNPNFEEFPTAKHVSFFAVHLKPGDLLFLPEGWFHQVRSLTSSLSINFWVNSVREKIDSN
ncbi:Cupin-like domain protein [compost metagenome]